MTDITGQIAFHKESIPRHIERNTNFGNSLPYMSLSGPITHQSDSGAIAIKGQPRLGVSSDSVVIAQRVLEAYVGTGAAILNELRGPFSVVIFDSSAHKCLIAIDRMGIERLAWGRTRGWVAVGSSVSNVASDLASHPPLNQQALFNFMYSHMIPAPDTVFQDVAKLLPGTAIEFSEEGQHDFRYWQPDFRRDDKVDIDHLREETRPILRKAIERTNPGDQSGTFLSGGLDSSTVTGLLADVQSDQIKAFSVGFGVDEYDEMEFARAAANHFGCSHQIYEVTASDIVDLIPKIAAAYDEPFGNSSAIPTFCCARLARNYEVDHLLGGDGGDEIFGGNERYVRHRIFELYNRVPAWMKNKVFGPLAETVNPESGIYPFRKISSYVQQAQIPLPDRFESWNLIYREGAERIFSEEFRDTVDPTHLFERMSEVWQSCPSDDLLDKMLWYDWKFTLADNDIRKVSRMCELAGVRVSYPMLDEEFVEHSMKIPSSSKIKGYELRTFFKNAVKGFVPDMVISKEKHGFGLPFGVWLKEDLPLQNLVYGSLESLRHRNIFETAFLDRVVAEHKEGHASYYGYAIWDLVMLEQWLTHHAS
ncbi:MAG: asparagine synthase-related protein [Gammaproteobacteria bacterium]|nr:asparagine synthase-related protein [Gammaproteobacteria bacterium]